MQILDIILLIPLAWALYKGFKKGLVIEITSLLALVLGVYGAIKFSSITADFLIEKIDVSEQTMKVLAFVVTFMLIIGAVHLIGKIIEKTIDLVALSFMNKLGGALFSTLKVAMIISVILVAVNGWNERFNFIPTNIKQDSILFEPMTKLSPAVLPFLKNSEWVQKGLQKLNELKEESGILDVIPNQEE